MDPNTVWQRIVLLRNLPERDEADENELDYLEGELTLWINKGGFLPEGYTND